MIFSLVNIVSIRKNNTLKAALLASSSFDSNTFRNGFDVAVPQFNPLTAKLEFKKQPWPKREYFLLSTQIHMDKSIDSFLLNFEQKNDKFKVFQLCKRSINKLKSNHSHRSNADYLQRCIKSKLFSYKDLISNARFCLIVKPESSTTSSFAELALFDSLKFNCLPVIVTNEWILPFSQVIDWSLMSIQIDMQNMNRLLKILEEISPARLSLMYSQLEFVFERYFSSIQAITLNTLDIISSRIYPTKL